ncbi:ATP-binding cassette domain-containing protein [uncultured Salinisphaera sp.]|uniref:ATP-binding cassette domain-containing protein n=1 Tax=uncultured Salinisphaera sp. TaxID=359372 RepID=UPI0032B30008|tara:strand:- start:2296 stop:3078 length:783 start_codon:yes stop_codon:yes gene_type:complete
MSEQAPLIRLSGVSKSFGPIDVLQNINLDVPAGEVACVLGDNGAGKSTLINIIAGLHQHSGGTFEVDGRAVHFDSPRQALDRGISAVYQHLALVPLLPVWRNFFLGSEIMRGRGVFARLDKARMKAITDDALRQMGIVIKDLEQPVGTLSGGQRQCVSIARAIHFGARLLILDEPTAALGVKQSGVVLKYIAKAARESGVGVVFITHNPHHAYMVGDSFAILARGEIEMHARREDLTVDDLIYRMAGGAELESLQHEMGR